MANYENWIPKWNGGVLQLPNTKVDETYGQGKLPQKYNCKNYGPCTWHSLSLISILSEEHELSLGNGNRRKNAKNVFYSICSFYISLSKTFWAIFFLLLFFSNWNFHDVCQRFLYNQKRNFSWIRQKTNIFPLDPHYKNRPLS